MVYRYVLVEAYRVKGLAEASASQVVELVGEAGGPLRAYLTTDLQSAFVHADARSAAGRIVMRGLFGKEFPGSVDERMAVAIAEIREEREKQFGRGPFLVIEAEGELEAQEPQTAKELDKFILWINGASTTEAQAETRTKTEGMIAALALTADSLLGVEKVGGGMVLFTPGDKPIYSLTFTASASLYVSRAVAPEVLKTASKWYEGLAGDRSLQRVCRLLVASLETANDRLRSFIAAWSALEIFVAKVFEQYQNQLFASLADVAHPGARNHHLDRIRDVMQDKYRLMDKFSVIACELEPGSVDSDLALFKAAKDIRDDLFHGQDVEEASLPTDSVRELLAKYLRLHTASDH